MQQRVTSQTTFATLLKCSDGTYALKAVKVKIEVRTKIKFGFNLTLFIVLRYNVRGPRYIWP